MVTYNTPSHTMRHGQYLRAAAFEDGVLPMQVYGENLNSSEDVGYEEGIPKFPLSPQGSGGYLLRMTGDERVALMHRTLFDKYVGVSHIASEQGDQISVRYEGVVWLPVGKIAVVAGDIVQATPNMWDGTGEVEADDDDAYDGDIIPAFTRAQVIHSLLATVDGTAYTLPGGIEVLRILSGQFFLGALNASADAEFVDQTVVLQGFSGAYGGGDVADGEIALYNAVQGAYATQIISGSTYTDGIFILDCWVKSDRASLPEWYVGKALHAGAARVSATSFDLVPVQLRGF